MKKVKILRYIIVLMIVGALVFSSSSITADTLEPPEPQLGITTNSGDYVNFLSSYGNIIWNNGMNYDGLYAAQWDSSYPFDCFQADDFQFDVETGVYDVHWIGGYWNDAEYYLGDLDWYISFMSDDGTGTAPDSHPQTPSYAGPFYFEWEGIEKEVIEDTGSVIYYQFSIILPEIIDFPSGEKFWISIWSDGPVFPQGGWAYHEAPIELNPTVWGSDYFSWSFWTPGSSVQGIDHDMCFQLTAPTVTPPIVEETLNPGETLEIEKLVTTPRIPVSPDIYFLCDTTESMSPVISAIQSDINTIMSNIIAIQPDAQFGVGNYKDFPYDPYAFLHDVSITDDTSAISTAIGTWTASGGADYPEAQFYALTELATNPLIGWRTDSTKIVVWFGDCPGHDPIPMVATGYGYEVTEATVISDLQTAGILVIAISTPTLGDYPDGLNSDPNIGGGDYNTEWGTIEDGSPGQATRITDATGGYYMLTSNPADVSDAIIYALEQVVTDVWWEIAYCDPELTVTLDPIVYNNIPGDVTLPFIETIEVDNDADIGTYTCIVEFYSNHYPEEGQLIGTQEIIIHVIYNIDKHYTHTDVNFNPWHYETEILFSEDFSECFLSGWTPRARDVANWDCSGTLNPLGTAPEARFHWFPRLYDASWLKSPFFSTMGMDIVEVSYWQYVDWFEDSFRLLVQARYNGGSWITLERTRYTSSTGPEMKSFMLPAELLDKPEVQLRFRFVGDSYDIDDWYIDDVLVEGQYKFYDPAELGTPLESVHLVTKGNKVKSTNPGQLYAVIEITGPVQTFRFRDDFDVEFDINPAKILTGGVQVIILDPWGYAIDITDSIYVNIIDIDNDDNTVIIDFDFPGQLADDYTVMIYLKFQTVYKHQVYDSDDSFWDNAKVRLSDTPSGWDFKTGRVHLPITGIPEP